VVKGYDASQDVEGDETVQIGQLLDDFLHLLDTHNDDDSFEYIQDELGYCDVKYCKMLEDHEEGNRDDLSDFFGNDDFDGAHSYKCLVNRIHVFYAHSYDIGYRLTVKEKSKIEESSRSRRNDQRNIKNCTFNPEITELRQIMSTKFGNNEVKKIQNRGKSRYNHVQLKGDGNNNGECHNYGTYYLGVEFIYDDENGEQTAEYENRSVIHVKSKYLCLKEELLRNPFIILTIGQYRNEYRKATGHFQCEFRRKCHPDLQLDHILALMIYANFEGLIC